MKGKGDHVEVEVEVEVEVRVESRSRSRSSTTGTRLPICTMYVHIVVCSIQAVQSTQLQGKSHYECV